MRFAKCLAPPVLVLLAVLATGAATSLIASPVLAQETLRLSVASSLRKTLFEGLDVAFKKESGISVVYIDNDPVAVGRFMDLLEGKVDAAVSSLDYADWVKTLKIEKNVDVPKSANITHRVVGRNLLYILANKANGVKSLSLARLEDIFTGKAKSWKQVGGNDVPVKVFVATDRGGSQLAFRKMVIKGQPFPPGTTELAADQALEAVNETPGGVMYHAYRSEHPNVVILETPPIGRPTTLITKGRPSDAMEKLIRFLRKRSEGGQGK